jgi:N-acetyl-gamma-glutamyl-phosphate reductase
MRILDGHQYLDLVFAGSRELAGEEVPSVEGLTFESLGPDEVAQRELDAIFLALPDGIGKPWLDAMPDDTVVVDISADHRFSDDWV